MPMSEAGSGFFRFGRRDFFGASARRAGVSDKIF